MNGFWAIWIAIGGNAVFLAVVAFLGKSVISQWLTRDLERFKTDIRSAAGAELERLRGALQIAAAEHSILLSRLQDRRAEVIDQLYGKLAKAIAAITSYVQIFELAGAPPKEEKARTAAEALISFRDYFDEKRIWLPPECCDKVDALESGLRDIYNNFSLDRTWEQRGLRTDPAGWQKAWEGVTKNLVPPARVALEAEMRRLLEPQPAARP
jgi:hypothetical protein